jgi:hypothetical protein
LKASSALPVWHGSSYPLGATYDRLLRLARHAGRDMQFSATRGGKKEQTLIASKPPRGFGLWAISLVAVAFGLLTIKQGGTVLFGGESARVAAGAYVPFVLAFNFGAGFAYVLAGAGLWLQRRWALWLAIAIALTTGIVFAAFGAHVYFGGAYKQVTVYAMTLRTALWLTIALIVSRRGILRRLA